MYKLLLSLLLEILLVSSILSQSMVANPSFEDKVGIATVPNQWNNCTNNSTPDILPGVWDVTMQASHGDSYLGLIIRKNGSRESIGQKMPLGFQKDYCYEFSIDLSRSNMYSGYNTPIGLKIWIGNGPCTQDQMIFYASSIEDTNWESNLVRFVAQEDFNYIKISPVPAKGIMFDYDGNILIDNISDFKICNRT